jgi:hypothetical protein
LVGKALAADSGFAGVVSSNCEPEIIMKPLDEPSEIANAARDVFDRDYTAR